MLNFVKNHLLQYTFRPFFAYIYCKRIFMDGTNEKCRELYKLMERHGKFVEFLCRWESYGREQWCADLMQECFLELMRRLPERDARWGEAHEKAWVYWRCRAVFVAYRRKQKRMGVVPISSELEEALTASSEVTRLTVDDLAACLDGPERQCFLLMAEGLSDEEIERRLGLKHRTLIQMRHNIKKKLHQYYC